MLSVVTTDSGVMLSGPLGREVAEELRQRLLEAVAWRTGDWTVDLSEVTSIDTAIIQVLLALRVQDPNVRVVAATGEVLGWLMLGGVTIHLA
jgi:anti-anti-sigma regulatory factor